MELIITETAKADIKFFLKSGQTSLIKKIENLLESVKETPFTGIGKPEALRYEHSGKWSRRISEEHRLVYRIEGDTIFILSAKGHYK